jgi:uncharacterized phage protein (TIGR02220 family)
MRIRTVKPSFFLHGDLYDLEIECKAPVRLAYAGLWCAADREGRFAWKPRELKAQILPHDNVDFSRVLDALATRGFLVRYTSQGKDFGWIPTFKDHQVINNKEAESVLPDPCDATTSTRAPRVPHACPTPLILDQGEGKGREGNKEGKGKEQEGNRKDASKRVLARLNEKSGGRFREVDSHLKLIAARLSEPGVTEDGVMTMIDRQCARWLDDPKMAEYLRPQTLFAKEKFNGYYDMRDAPVTQPNGHRRPSAAGERNAYIGTAGGTDWGEDVPFEAANAAPDTHDAGSVGGVEEGEPGA